MSAEADRLYEGAIEAAAPGSWITFCVFFIIIEMIICMSAHFRFNNHIVNEDECNAEPAAARAAAEP